MLIVIITVYHLCFVSGLARPWFPGLCPALQHSLSTDQFLVHCIGQSAGVFGLSGYVVWLLTLTLILMCTYPIMHRRNGTVFHYRWLDTKTCKAKDYSAVVETCGCHTLHRPELIVPSSVSGLLLHWAFFCIGPFSVTGLLLHWSSPALVFFFGPLLHCTIFCIGLPNGIFLLHTPVCQKLHAALNLYPLVIHLCSAFRRCSTYAIFSFHHTSIRITYLHNEIFHMHLRFLIYMSWLVLGLGSLIVSCVYLKLAFFNNFLPSSKGSYCILVLLVLPVLALVLQPQLSLKR